MEGGAVDLRHAKIDTNLEQQRIVGVETLGVPFLSVIWKKRVWNCCVFGGSAIDGDS